jgi:TPR repeat protein
MNLFLALPIPIILCFLAVLSARGQPVAAASVGSSAFERIKAKAEANDAAAQLELGWMYDKGESVPRDPEQAFRWWLKAAEQGQPAGQFNVGLSYSLGLGVTRDYSEAAKWYQKTVEPMDTFASYELGWMSAAGRGIPKNHDAAVKRWKESLFQGYAVAKRELDFVEFSYSGTRVFLGRVEMATNTPVGMTAYRGYRIARGELEFPCITFMNHEGRLLEDVHVIRTDPVSLFYRFADGVCCGEEKLANLPLEFQKRFNYDAQKAAAYEATQKAARLAQEAHARRSEATDGSPLLLEPSLQDSQNDGIVSEIVSNYHKTHTYVGTQTGAKADIFVCGDMACDVWNMIETKGIKARIQIGNVKTKIKSLLDADHAWVMAEVSPGKWLALETTGGDIIRFNENNKYYVGHSFSDPKEYKEYSTLAREYNTAIGKERNAVKDYNQMVNQYNGAGDPTNVRLTSELDRKAAVVDSRRADLQEVAGRLKTLLLEKD